MRRENRRKNSHSKMTTDKIILYAGIGVAILAVVVFALFMYSKNLSDDMKNSSMSLEQMANMANNNTVNTESASTEIGKSVEESANELKETNTTNSMNTTNSASNQTTNNTTNTNKTNNTANTTTNTNTTNAETKKELSFEKPVEGEIMREYAKDNLIYSATLAEWTTHTGIDIKADKTTVVKAAEAGTVKSIKNDPRYGLTIVIEHEDNFQTVYANLLTSEFVVEGEKVEKGQSIGTVGNTAVFEIADEPHLHFEILKDSLPVDPSIYIK
ncbi:MAG: M23 family metallopeptidase [Clostridia bacterium]|nr:M23 family metallopeptidase [Clostridia bacterium]